LQRSSQFPIVHIWVDMGHCSNLERWITISRRRDCHDTTSGGCTTRV
jgi:hypothetical protein